MENRAISRDMTSPVSGGEGERLQERVIVRGLMSRGGIERDRRGRKREDRMRGVEASNWIIANNVCMVKEGGVSQMLG